MFCRVTNGVVDTHLYLLGRVVKGGALGTLDSKDVFTPDPSYPGEWVDVTSLAPNYPMIGSAYVNGSFTLPASQTPTPQDQSLRVDTFRDNRLAAGYTDQTAGLPSTGKTFQCDDKSVGRWDAIGSAAGLATVMNTTPAPNFDVICADNTTITLSAAQAYALFQGRVMPWVSATVLFARSLKDQILTGTPPEDITQGWP